MLETAPFLFEDFSNKDKIMQRIKDLPITRNTVKSRILKIAENKEELVKLVSLQETTKGTDICKAVVNTLSEANVDFSRIVSVTTDGADQT
ncbi:unnamed protein product [Macrosiphum euphorbiae]|uniref:DUF4371 domain-containing protein n=1 Tax=Macrosiphum euphorbiae TaxID=13131 RepID=A0AAV0WIS1_9HEMI|nr:unnamed protein product [Macrosiphum euphorbiae]